MCFNCEVYAKIDIHLKTWFMMRDQLFYQRPENTFANRMTKRPRLLTRRGLFATKNYLDSDSVVSSVSGAFSSSAAAIGWLSAFLVTRAIAFLEKSR